MKYLERKCVLPRVVAQSNMEEAIDCRLQIRNYDAARVCCWYHFGIRRTPWSQGAICTENIRFTTLPLCSQSNVHQKCSLLTPP